MWHAPGGPGVRVDSHVASGYRVPSHYDSLLGKLIVQGEDRADALRRLRAALDEMQVEGIDTNLPLHRALAADEQWARGEVDIHHLERWLGGRA